MSNQRTALASPLIQAQLQLQVQVQRQVEATCTTDEPSRETDRDLIRLATPRAARLIAPNDLGVLRTHQVVISRHPRHGTRDPLPSIPCSLLLQKKPTTVSLCGTPQIR